MGQRQLNIRSDEAAQRAARLSKQLGKTTTEVVTEALRAYDQASAARGDGMTEDQQAEFEALCELSRRTASDPSAAHAASNDHTWLYDDHGLPK